MAKPQTKFTPSLPETAHPMTDVALMLAPMAGPGGGGPGGGGNPGGGGSSGNGNGNGGGPPPGSGTKKGDLYGDQYVLLRDLDSSDGGGNGEPILDENGQMILVGSDGRLIYFELDAETGDYIIPAEDADFVQTVDLGRANVARAPSKVMQKSLDAALAKIEGATEVTTDAAGRIVCDGATIDSPLENLALYQFLMTAGGHTSWTDVVTHWPSKLQALDNWDPSSLLGAAFDKAAPISMDAVLYENTVLGINQVSNGQVTYFSFSDNGSETYDYSRDDRFDGVWLQWYEDTDDDGELEQVQESLMNAVFGGKDWVDAYLTVSGETLPAETSGVNDFAQAVDDSRAVIEFMHGHYGAVVIGVPPTPPEPVVG